MKFIRLIKSAYITDSIDVDFPLEIIDENKEGSWDLTIEFTANKLPADYNTIDTSVGYSTVKVSEPSYEDFSINSVYNNTLKKYMDKEWISTYEDNLIDILENSYGF